MANETLKQQILKDSLSNTELEYALSVASVYRFYKCLLNYGNFSYQDADLLLTEIIKEL